MEVSDDLSQHLRDPSCFVIESPSAATLEKEVISLPDVEAGAPLQFAQIDGTEMQRACVALGQMIRSIHQTAEEDAMLDAEHVRRLVRQHLAAPAQDAMSIAVGKRREVAREAVDADALTQRGLPEDEIPRRLRIQIDHRDGDDAK